MSHPAPARRHIAPVLGAAALALALTGCGGGESTSPSSAAPAPAGGPSTPGVAATATGDPESPASQAAAQIREARASERAEGSDRPEPREALETVGPGVSAGAATQGWQNVASRRNDSVAVMDCTQDVLEQATLDAVATHIPVANDIAIVQLFASRDQTHEFLTCQYQGSSSRSEGAPLVMVHYQHNLDGSRLDWCQEEPAVRADEYSFDPATGRGLLALLRPGMVGGSDGAPLLPQRTGWACTEDGTQLVSVTFGSMEGYGPQNEGLTQVVNSPVANSTTVVTQARDHLADTVLKDPAAFQEVISVASPYFLNAQMDQETLDRALQIPTGLVPEEMLNDQSTIERPEGAPEPVAPSQPPRPFVGAAREAAESAAAASASASAAASASPSEGQEADPEGGAPAASSPAPSPSPTRD
ncbi:hypothetical protein [Micrococcus sp.]|uniref:hypothetical protein n=1 Tax=Micrococcus sp. TaxID=1271 RepID=UPI0026DBD54E|nr:hypothetical protein [Micrococcus sp.]MDO4239337.1 hypothetical protein [Micrococcus sp.]